MPDVTQKLSEIEEFLECQYSEEDMPDPVHWAMDECGKVSPNGPCLHAGTEYCDFECIFN